MIWLAWRQHRMTLLAFAALFGALTLIYLIFTGSPRNYTLENVADLMWLVPGVIGVFAGAPLVANELAHGTHRYVWTQEITRSRWLWTKLALLASVTLVLGVVFSLVYRGWFAGNMSNDSPPGLYNFWMPFRGFELGPLVFPAYCLFGFALAVAVGTLLRRTIPAMAAALFGVPAIILLVQTKLRPNYQPPIVLTAPSGDSARFPDGVWALEADLVDRAGNILDFTEADRLAGLDPYSRIPFEQTKAAYESAGIQIRQMYQPPDRFWTFQAIEAGLFVLLAAACVALTFWWLRRRLV